MKKELLICIAFLVSVAGFAQKQVTDVYGTQTLNTLLEPVGQIGKNYFFHNPGHSIEKVNLEAMTIQSTLTFTKDQPYNYRPLVASGRLFLGYFDWNVNEVKIFELDPESGKHVDTLIIPNSNDLLFSFDSYYVIHNNYQGVQQIRFNEKGHTRSDVLGSNLKFYSRNLVNTIINFKDETGNTVYGFLDGNNTFHETGPTGYAIVGSEFTNHYVFLPPFNANEAYIYNKEDGKTTQFFKSDTRARKNFQFLEYREELYSLEELTETKGSGTSITYSFYKYKEDDTETLFSGEIPAYMFYNIGGWIVGGGQTYTYSNPLFDGESLYFWGNEAYDRTSVKTLKLYNINVHSKSVSGKPVTDNGMIDLLRISEYRYGMQLDYFNGNLTTTTNSEPYFSFSLNIKTGKFEAGTLLYQKEILKVNDSLSLNLSYPQRVIFENGQKQSLKTLRSEAAGHSDVFKRYFNNSEQLIIPNEQSWDVYVYFGNELARIDNFLDKDFLNVKEKIWSEIRVGNKYVLYVHGLHSDGTDGSSYYTFDIKTNTFERFYRYNTHFLNYYFNISKPRYGDFVLINLPDNKVLVTDFKDHFELNHNSQAELVHSFSNQTFLISLRNAGTYFSDPKIGKWVKISNEDLNNSNIQGDTFVYLKSGALFSIDGSGKENMLFSANTSPMLNKKSDAELIFTTSGRTGLINTISGKIFSFSSPGNASRIDKFFDLHGQLYGFSFDNHLYSVDFEKGKLVKLSNLKFGSGAVKNGGIAYLTEFTPSDNKYRMWKLEGQKLEYLFSDEDPRKIHKLNQPLIIKGQSYQFWLPENGKWINLQSGELDSFHYFEYLTQNAQMRYFRAYKPDDSRYYLVKIDINTLKIKTIWSGEGYEFILKIFNNELYMATENGVWKSTGEEMTLENELIFAPFGKDGREPFLEFRNNLYIWAYDNNGLTQLFQFTENEISDILLPTENPALNFSFYPNPTADYLNISSTAGNREKYKVTVINTEGKVLSEQNLDLPGKVDLSRLKTGIYLIHVRSGRDSQAFRVMKY